MNTAKTRVGIFALDVRVAMLDTGTCRDIAQPRFSPPITRIVMLM
jgi:hypothetical protein